MNIPLLFSSAFDLSTSPQKISLTDLTDYASQGIAATQVKGCFVLSNQYGGMFYSNTNFSTPDISGATLPFNPFVTNAPLDQHGAVLNGKYTFDYKVEISAEAFSLPIIGIDQPGQRFIVAGNQINNVLNAIGGDIIIVGGANVGTYAIDVATCSYDSVNNKTYIGVSSAIPSASDMTSPVTFTANTTYTVTQTIIYGFKEPHVHIEAIDDCFKSALVVNDLTDLSAKNNGVVIQPASINGTITINYPIDPATSAPMAAPIVVSINNAGISYTVNPICTGAFQIEYNVTVVYVLPDGTTITVLLMGKKDHEVECEAGLCCALQCIENVYRNWNRARGNNLEEAESYQKLLLNILGCWMLYTSNSECGTGDPNKWLAEIVSLVKTHNCTCCPENSNAPVWITSSITAGAAASIVIAGTGIIVTPTGTNPVTYTVTLNQSVVQGLINSTLSGQKIMDHADTVIIAPMTTGQLLMYNVGTQKWNNITLTMSSISDIDMTGAATDYVLTYDSVTGKASFKVSGFHTVLLNDISNVGTPANLVETLLKGFTIAANTLVNDGDFLTIEFGVKMLSASSISPNVLKLYFGATPTLRFSNLYASATSTSYEIKVSKTSSSTVYAELKETRGQLPSVVIGNVRVSYNESSSNALIFNITGTNGLALANQIVCNYLRITKSSI